MAEDSSIDRMGEDSMNIPAAIIFYMIALGCLIYSFSHMAETYSLSTGLVALGFFAGYADLLGDGK